MSLKTVLRTAAASYSGLTALIGTNPLRMYDIREMQGGVLPAICMQLISSSPTYVVTGRLRTGWSRIQFTIWGAGSDSSSAMAVEAQLIAFLDQLNIIGIPGLFQYPNFVMLQMDAMQPQTQPPVYQRILDVKMFTNDRYL